MESPLTGAKSISAAKFGLVRVLAIYFFNGTGGMKTRFFRCVFCERLFGQKRSLNTHYFEAHGSAFSEEELSMASVRRVSRTQHVRRLPVYQGELPIAAGAFTNSNLSSRKSRCTLGAKSDGSKRRGSDNSGVCTKQEKNGMEQLYDVCRG